MEKEIRGSCRQDQRQGWISERVTNLEETSKDKGAFAKTDEAQHSINRQRWHLLLCMAGRTVLGVMGSAEVSRASL